MNDNLKLKLNLGIDEIKIPIKFKPMISLWAAIKIRIAGFKECNIHQCGTIKHIEFKK